MKRGPTVLLRVVGLVLLLSLIGLFFTLFYAHQDTLQELTRHLAHARAQGYTPGTGVTVSPQLSRTRSLVTTSIPVFTNITLPNNSSTTNLVDYLNKTSPELLTGPDILSCPYVHHYNSITSDGTVVITFHNKKSIGVRLIWVNKQGEEIIVATLDSGQSMPLPSYHTHGWLARNLITEETYRINNSCIYVAGDQAQQTVIIEDSPVATNTSFKVLCWILCDINDLTRRVIHVKNTWMRRCDIPLYITSVQNNDFPTIGMNVTTGRDHIASKAKAAWKYIYKNYYDKADFFMKADPDTYVIIENLKSYLATKNTSEPEFYGHRFYEKGWRTPYMSGGPGLVITRESLKRLVTDAFNRKDDCMPDGQLEDWKSGQCLYLVGCRPVDSRDELGRERFNVFNPTYHLADIVAYPDWYKKREPKGGTKGPECCSNYPISFHYIKPDEMYVLEYFIYRVSPYWKIDLPSQPP